jgi:(1->4)-alpha-D-glucan 1-alpha-D-glucosylmutase
MKDRPVLRCTYRLQFNREFTFADATALVPYLYDLGISHIYASPYLKARTGSLHGYDIVDHGALNPEIGDAETFGAMTEALHRHGMGQILDIVPNHMGVGGNDNQWWLSVLEHGEASPYAAYFDIDWKPEKPELTGKVLLPFLGAHYGKVLEAGDLKLRFDADQGEFSVYYHEHRFPIDPASYPTILNPLPGGESAGTVPQHASDEFRRLTDALEKLPPRAPNHDARVATAGRYKQRLAQLARTVTGVAEHIRRRVAAANGAAGDPASFDHLHQLLEQQAYRLSYWQVARDEINYRRFFDINDLAALRMENPRALRATHRLIARLVQEGQVDGLRIDHPDGLYDPRQYLIDLQALLADDSAEPGPAADAAYVVVEKILATHERLPENWPVAGTTGYDFSHAVNGLFVSPAGQRALTTIYARFTGNRAPFEEIVYHCKKLIMRTQLSGELSVLANLLNRIAQADRHTRDFTLMGLRNALTEVVACFPVYRTYVSPHDGSTVDRDYIQWAVAQARKRSPAADRYTFDFIHRILSLENLDQYPAGLHTKLIQFVRSFQQYTSPVMAKGLEDTASYRYNRLVSLNEVGGDPDTFGVSLQAFHHINGERARCWPGAMLNTSTHDSKRGEDVRARLNVLSELPELWRRHLARWSRLNRTRRRKLDGRTAPSRNDEYLFYQTLLGLWPLDPPTEATLARLRQRIDDYMLKALREAKVHTSWITPDEAYESAVRAFVAATLRRLQRNRFLDDFMAFQQQVAWFGMLNSLSQLALKLASPGIPDLYQGSELWRFTVVDPDNRRAVDYSRRQRLLKGLQEQLGAAVPLAPAVRGLLDHLADGRAKLYLTWKGLALRKARAELFIAGEYLPVSAAGAKSEHVCAFVRRWEDHAALAVAPRWYATLTGGATTPPLGADVWSDTHLELPEWMRGYCYNVLSGETIAIGSGGTLELGQILTSFPVALLQWQLT